MRKNRIDVSPEGQYDANETGKAYLHYSDRYTIQLLQDDTKQVKGLLKKVLNRSH